MIGNIIQGAGLAADIVGGIISNIGNKNEGRINREFQAQQAQLARDWQEDMYNKYSSPSAMVQQYKDAGLNPALMFNNGQSVGQGFNTSSPSGAQATLINPADNLLSKLQSIVQLKEMIENNKSQRDLQAAQANELNSRSSLNQSNINLNSANVNKINNEIEEIKARTKNETDRNALIALEKTFKQLQNTNISYDNLKEEWAKNFKDTFGAYPAENAYQAVQRVIFVILDKLGLTHYISGD